MSTSEHQSLLGYTARPHEPINAQKIEKKRFSGCCVKCCFLLLIILAVVCTVIAVLLGALYGSGVIKEELHDYIATVSLIIITRIKISNYASIFGLVIKSVVFSPKWPVQSTD